MQGWALGRVSSHSHGPQEHASQPQTPERNSITAALCLRVQGTRGTRVPAGARGAQGVSGHVGVQCRGPLGPVSGCSPTGEPAVCDVRSACARASQRQLLCLQGGLHVHGTLRSHVCVCTCVCLSGREDRDHAPSELSRQLPGGDISALTCVDKAGGTPGFLWSSSSKKPSPETPVLQTWHAPALWGLPDGEAKISPMSVRRQTPWRPEPPPCPGLSPRTQCRPAPCPRGRHQGPLAALHGPALCNRSPLCWRPHKSRQTRNWSFRNSTLRQEPKMGTHPPSGSVGHGAVPAVRSGSREPYLHPPAGGVGGVAGRPCSP